jgi:tripartite-type tricarboxylate transporter receptor subunit TctC
MKNLGAVIVGDKPAEFRAYLIKDSERWARVIRASGVKAQ